jgi:hypothetical protein
MFHNVKSKHPKGKTLAKHFFGEEDAFLFIYNKGKYVAHVIRLDNRDKDARFLELLPVFARPWERQWEGRVDAVQCLWS